MMMPNIIKVVNVLLVIIANSATAKYLNTLPQSVMFLMMPTGKDWCLTQFITEMAGWLLLIFSICLHNQLSSIHSIISSDV